MKKRNKASPPRFLRHIGERGFLSRILPRLTEGDTRRFRIGPGDDAAVLATPPGAVLSIDGLTEGVHFRSSWESLCRRHGLLLGRALGWKLMGASLSDLSAMGDVRERWALLFLGAPPRTSLSFLSDVVRGVKETARKWGCAVAGGDTVRSRVLTLVAAVGGQLRGGRVLTREGVREGDILCMTGTLGEADAGCRILLGKKKVRSQGDERQLVGRFFQPCPRFREGEILSKTQGVGGVIDLSDSLVESAALLVGKKPLGIDMHLDFVPLSPAVSRWFGRGPGLAACAEDYGLLFSLRPSAVLRLKKKMPFSILGRFHSKPKGVRLFLKGRSVPAPRAFQHFL